MGSRTATDSEDYGYEDNRFEKSVTENFHCSICLNVLKKPKMCRNNQHLFCSSCITRHLAQSSRCPECNEELTVETLNEAPRVLLNCLSELKIKCDYFSRGCREFVQLGNLSSHVRDCGFARVTCSNQGCGVEINKRDRIHHETNVCHFRKVQCHESGEIRSEMEKLKRNVAELNVNLAELRSGQAEQETSLAELKKIQDELKKNQEELKVNIKDLGDQLHSLKDDITNAVRSTIWEVFKSTNEVPTVHTSLRVRAAKARQIIIAGGLTASGHLTNSVEEFDWSNEMWSYLPPMKRARSSSSSFVYKNQIIVAGGCNGNARTAEMDAMQMNQEPLQWITFPGKLPDRLSSQGTIVYENRLIVVGGYNWNNMQVSNSIYDVLLDDPYFTKLLCLMPQERSNHGTEIINDKVYILGGTTSVSSKDAVDSVIAYDIVHNKCESMPSLPYAVWGMSTISWQNKVILLGGKDNNFEILNDVIMYDITTGESKRLPCMNYKRFGCSAVITGDCIVVMGGWNKDEKYLNAVECYSFSSNSWQELPPMNERRKYATAVIKPCYR